MRNYQILPNAGPLPFLGMVKKLDPFGPCHHWSELHFGLWQSAIDEPGLRERISSLARCLPSEFLWVVFSNNIATSVRSSTSAKLAVIRISPRNAGSCDSNSTTSTIFAWGTEFPPGLSTSSRTSAATTVGLPNSADLSRHLCRQVERTCSGPVDASYCKGCQKT